MCQKIIKKKKTTHYQEIHSYVSHKPSLLKDWNISNGTNLNALHFYVVSTVGLVLSEEINIPEVTRRWQYSWSRNSISTTNFSRRQYFFYLPKFPFTIFIKPLLVGIVRKKKKQFLRGNVQMKLKFLCNFSSDYNFL